MEELSPPVCATCGHLPGAHRQNKDDVKAPCYEQGCRCIGYEVPIADRAAASIAERREEQRVWEAAFFCSLRRNVIANGYIREGSRLDEPGAYADVTAEQAALIADSAVKEWRRRGWRRLVPTVTTRSDAGSGEWP